MASGGGTNYSLQNNFTEFAKYGDTKADGKTIMLRNADKWMKQAKVIDGKKVTTTDTGIVFNKMKSRTLSYPQFVKYIDEIATYKKMRSEEIVNKLVTCGSPGATHATEATRDDVVGRLTNTAQYTGTHKQRFDESGKGKGLSGREEKAEDRGYVGGYKGADTYDTTHDK